MFLLVFATKVVFGPDADNEKANVISFVKKKLNVKMRNLVKELFIGESLRNCLSKPDFIPFCCSQVEKTMILELKSKFIETSDDL